MNILRGKIFLEFSKNYFYCTSCDHSCDSEANLGQDLGCVEGRQIAHASQIAGLLPGKRISTLISDLDRSVQILSPWTWIVGVLSSKNSSPALSFLFCSLVEKLHVNLMEGNLKTIISLSYLSPVYLENRQHVLDFPELGLSVNVMHSISNLFSKCIRSSENLGARVLKYKSFSLISLFCFFNVSLLPQPQCMQQSSLL